MSGTYLDQNDQAKVFSGYFSLIAAVTLILLCIGVTTPVAFAWTRSQERREAQEQVRYLESHDALTGLANRRAYVEHLDEAIVRMKRDNTLIAVISLDIDRFKEINDTSEHGGGDQVPSRSANRSISPSRRRVWRLPSKPRCCASLAARKSRASFTDIPSPPRRPRSPGREPKPSLRLRLKPSPGARRRPHAPPKPRHPDRGPEPAHQRHLNPYRVLLLAALPNSAPNAPWKGPVARLAVAGRGGLTRTVRRTGLGAARRTVMIAFPFTSRRTRVGSGGITASASAT